MSSGGGTPYIWGSDKRKFDEDLDLIVNTKCLFARKFDMENYPEIVKKLLENLQYTHH